MRSNSAIYLLSIRGTLAPKTLVAARDLHNQTAGASQNVAAARSLGDMSHMVYVPVEHNGHQFGDFLILDQWNSLDGLNQFFANPHVQEQAGQIFSQRDPVVWAAAEGFVSYHFPAPYGKNDRYVGVVRGKVNSHAEAQKVHNEIIEKFVNKTRMAGNMSHEAYLRMAAPGSPEALEFFAVDVWMDADGMAKVYEDQDFLDAFGKLFATEPSASVWAHPDGQWVEW